MIFGVLLVAVIAILLWLVISDRDSELQTAPAGSFYVAPSKLPSGKPGDIIRTEPITEGVPEGARAWRILYRSTAFDTGKPIAVSGVIFVPKGRATRDGRPIVAWAHPTTGVASKCAPSIPANGGENMIPGLESFLQDGYAVVATDYPGLGTQGPHPYLVGSSEGRAVLDSVRAAQNFRRAGTGNRFVLWGHSQGGQAVLFSAQMAPTYAPELELVGVAAAAPAVKLEQLLKVDIAKTVGKVLGSQALVAWSKVYPDADLHQLLSNRSIPPAENIASRCITTKSDAYKDLVRVEELKVLGFVNPDALSTVQSWADIIKENTPGSKPIKAPLLIMQGTADEIVDPKTTAQYVKSLCAKHSQVEYQTIKGIDHDMAGFDSAPTVGLWAQDRFDGVKAPSNCID